MARLADVAEATVFQRLAVERITAVLAAHGIPMRPFTRIAADSRWLATDFEFRGQKHELLVAHDDAQMDVGAARYENYAYVGDQSDESVVEEFVTRLDRYLGGGAWEGPPEPEGLWRYLLRRLRGGVRKR